MLDNSQKTKPLHCLSQMMKEFEHKVEEHQHRPPHIHQSLYLHMQLWSLANLKFVFGAQKMHQ